jgi:hypothetical protein
MRSRQDMCAGTSKSILFVHEHIRAFGGSARDDELVNHLLARQLHLVHEPPDAWMEPERRSDGLLEHNPSPVSTRNVHEFVIHNRALRVETQFRKSCGQEDDWTSDAKGDRLREIPGPAELCSRRLSSQRLDIRSKDGRRTVPPKARQPVRTQPAATLGLPAS